MGRPLLIVGLVVMLMATGVAVASPADQVRHPVGSTVRGEAHSVTVEPGDHLWKISARHLGDGVPVAPYWRRVIDINTPSLRSGDPDLIYPGEVIELPPVSEQP